MDEVGEQAVDHFLEVIVAGLGVVLPVVAGQPVHEADNAGDNDEDGRQLNEFASHGNRAGREGCPFASALRARLT